MNRSMPKFVVALLGAVLMSWSVGAQELLWNATFDFRFDNRAFLSMAFSSPEYWSE